MGSDKTFRWKIGLEYLLLVVCLLAAGCRDATAQKVYITRTGEKYHRSGCRYLKYSSIEVELRDAKKSGYTPCSVCKPGTAEGAKEKDASTPVRPSEVTPLYKENKPAQTTAQQCTARTKAGSRCKRTTTNSNGRCWQHQ